MTRSSCPTSSGRSEDDAVNEIVGAGLRVGRIASQPPPPADSSPSATVPSGTRMVVRTIPGPGQRVYEGQNISLEVTQ